MPFFHVFSSDRSSRNVLVGSSRNVVVGSSRSSTPPPFIVKIPLLWQLWLDFACRMKSELKLDRIWTKLLGPVTITYSFFWLMSWEPSIRAVDLPTWGIPVWTVMGPAWGWLYANHGAAVTWVGISRALNLASLSDKQWRLKDVNVGRV